MNFEEKGKKTEQADSQENKPEKELSMSEINDLIKQKITIFDSLDKFSKDEIFKKENFEDMRTVVNRPNDKFDEDVYAKAGFWERYDNFFRFGFHKERHNLLKSKKRGLLDKTKINKDIIGKDIEIEQSKKSEREYLENNVIDIRGDFKKENFGRTIIKGFDEVDGEILKIVISKRTEKGQIEAAGKMREEKISQLGKIDGAGLVGLKESLEKSNKSKKNLSKVMEFMSDEEKEKITVKLSGEENRTKERIKEKEEKIAEEIKIFREPLEERLKETVEIENKLSDAFDFIKTSELNLNRQVKEYEKVIKEAQNLNLLGGVGGDIVRNLEEKKATTDARIKEFAEKKEIVASKLEVLKNNKKEIETNLSRINNIGKTKKETAEEEKDKKKVETKSAEEKRDEDENEDKSKKTEGRKKSKQKNILLNKGGDKKTDIGEIFEHFGDIYEEKGMKEVESPDAKTFSEKEIKNIVIKELETLGIMNFKSKTIREQITKNIIEVIKFMLAHRKEHKKEVGINDIKRGVKEWYEKLSKDYFTKINRSKS